MTKTQQIRELVTKRIADEERRLEIVREIHDILRNKFDGKKITKRLATLIENAHPSWAVFYKRTGASTFGMINLVIWGGDSGFPTHTDAMRVLVGYTNELESYDPKIFPERAVCYYAAVKRNKARRAFLDSEDPGKLALSMMNLQGAREKVKYFLNGSATCDSTGIAEIFGENTRQFY